MNSFEVMSILSNDGYDIFISNNKKYFIVEKNNQLYRIGDNFIDNIDFLYFDIIHEDEIVCLFLHKQFKKDSIDIYNSIPKAEYEFYWFEDFMQLNESPQKRTRDTVPQNAIDDNILDNVIDIDIDSSPLFESQTMDFMNLNDCASYNVQHLVNYSPVQTMKTPSQIDVSRIKFGNNLNRVSSRSIADYTDKTLSENATYTSSAITPTANELQQLLYSEPMTSIAKKFGVTDKTIKNWADKYSLDIPIRGYFTRKINKEKSS